MNIDQLNILLADDDADDCLFFKNALSELYPSALLTTVNDGEQLMNHLYESTDHLPDVLFLDLSMPRKNGFECLAEIKENLKLKGLHVIMFSTSFPRDPNYEQDLITRLLGMGAHYFIRKPGGFELLKQTIQLSLNTVIEKGRWQE